MMAARGNTATALSTKNQRLDADTETFIVHSLRADGFDASEDGTGRGTPIVPVAFYSNESHSSGENVDVSPTLRVGTGLGIPSAPAIAFNWQSGGDCRLEPREDQANTLQREQTQAVAFQCHGTNVGPMGLLRAGNGNETGGVPFVIQPNQTGGNGANISSDDVSYTLDSKSQAVAFQTRIARNGRGQPEEICPTLQGADAGATSDMRPMIATTMAVRRLLPVECEKLQGFSPGYTAIPYRGKPAADGPRYRALGNSMAVPVMRWIGERIVKFMAAVEQRKRGAA
jgi:DNA (cytosine-5)-methyltransferase 1